MNFKPVNFRMIAHPMNWVTIILMLLIVAAFGHTVLTLFGVEPSRGKTVSLYNAIPAGVSKIDTASNSFKP